MSWKSIVITGLLCVVASPVLAVPSIIAKPTYSAANGGIMWEIQIQQDTDNSLAVELPIVLNGFTPAFTTFLNDSGGDATNGAANTTWYYNETAASSGTIIWNITDDPVNAANEEQNTGNNPFTGTVTEGLQIEAANKRLFAALGSSINLPDADAGTAGKQVATLHILTSDGQLNWTDAIVAEGGMNNTITGLAGSVVRGDMNGNGSRNFLDVAPFGTALSNPAGYATQFPGLDRIARGDMNGNGALNFLDVAGFGNCLSNPATCIANPVATPGSGSASVSGAAVPEPASLALLLLSALAGVGLRRRVK